MFTSHKDTDFEVLDKLNDYDLVSTCRVNSYFRKLCNDDKFWLNRTIKRFGQVLEGIEEIRKYKQKYNFATWKTYYISLINQIELYYQGYETGMREDWQIIKDKIEENTVKFKCADVKCIQEALKYDFINLAQLWYNSDLKDNEAVTALDILLKDLRFKITPSVIFHTDDKELEIMISKRNNAHTRESILKMFIRNFLDINTVNLVSSLIEKKDIWNILFTKLSNPVDAKKISILLKMLIEKGSDKRELLEGYENLRLNRSVNRNNLEIMKKYINSIPN